LVGACLCMYVCMYIRNRRTIDGRDGGKRERGRRGANIPYLTLPYLPTHLPLKRVNPKSSSWLQFNSSPLETQAFPSYPWAFRHYGAVRCAQVTRAAHGMRKHRVGGVCSSPALAAGHGRRWRAARPAGVRAGLCRPTDPAQPSHCRSERYYTVVDRQIDRQTGTATCYAHHCERERYRRRYHKPLYHKPTNPSLQ
jgi:hypothetical protein